MFVETEDGTELRILPAEGGRVGVLAEHRRRLWQGTFTADAVEAQVGEPVHLTTADGVQALPFGPVLNTFRILPAAEHTAQH